MRNPFKMARWEWKFLLNDFSLRLGRLARRAIPSWSSLRTLGKSRLVGATMLVPFLGTIILFNHTVLEAIQIPKEILTSLGINLDNDLQNISIARLKMTYFGLCLVGVASFCFILLCPDAVKRYGSAAEFVRGDEPLFTGPRVEASAGDIISNFENKTCKTEYGRRASFSCPDNLIRQTEIFLNEIGTKMVEEDEDSEIEFQKREKLDEETLRSAQPDPEPFTDEERVERQAEEEKRFLWNRHGPGIDIDKILDLIFSGSRAEEGYFYRLAKLGRDYKTDVMSLTYMWDDANRPLSRAVISSVFAAGFLLLSIPTVFTFIAVFRQTLM